MAKNIEKISPFKRSKLVILQKIRVALEIAYIFNKN